MEDRRCKAELDLSGKKKKLHKVWYIVQSYHEGSGTGTIYYYHSLTLIVYTIDFVESLINRYVKKWAVMYKLFVIGRLYF